MGSNERRRKKFKVQVITLILIGGLLYAGLKTYETYLAEKAYEPLSILHDGVKKGEFKVEVADSEPEHTRGLMFRKELGNREGMIFVYDVEKIQTFWMKNTYIPLDMLFIDKNKKIVGILKNIPPLNEEKRSVEIPSQYVLELKAGTSDELKILEGDTVSF